jgi:HAD superfamily hydrolase (TIGR01509 family)
VDSPPAASRAGLDCLEAFRPRGVVFDLDGTIVDNMALHAEAFATFVARHGLPPLTHEDRVRLDGKRNRDLFPLLLGRPLSDAEWQAHADEKEALYREISAGRLTPLPGFTRLLAALEARGIPVAIATSAPDENVAHTLRELGLGARLSTVVRADQVPRGKPFPDVFLAAAAAVGAEPATCLAFEDAPAGVAAAKAAGMACVALTTGFAAATLLAPDRGADAAFPDFDAYLDGPGRWLLREPAPPVPRGARARRRPGRRTRTPESRGG